MAMLDRKAFDWNDKLVRFGTYLSFGWLAVAGTGLWLLADWSEPLKPNAWGDLAAGIAAPLAFLWLVLGFMQQGRELKLQIQELRNTVQHQADLAEATREQVAVQLRQEEDEKRQRRLAAQPRFVLTCDHSHTGPTSVAYKMYIANGGAIATNVTVLISAGPQPDHTHFFSTIGHNLDVSLELRYTAAPPVLHVLLLFMDADGNDGAQRFAGSLEYDEGRYRFISVNAPEPTPT